MGVLRGFGGVSGRCMQCHCYGSFQDGMLTGSVGNVMEDINGVDTCGIWEC